MTKLQHLLMVCVLFCVQAISAPGETQTNTLTFAWDPNPSDQGVISYNLYYRTNIPAGMSLAEAPDFGKVITWSPAAGATGWTLLKTVPGTQTTVTITNVWGMKSPVFFTLTAKNVLVESDFSNVAWIPAAPARQGAFRLLSAE